MKKTVAILVSLMMLCSFALADGMVLGGWSLREKLEALTESEQATFSDASGNLLGVQYEPITVLETQVVSGTNTCYLAKGTTVTANPVSFYAIVKVYTDLSGKSTITSIEDLEPIDGFEDYDPDLDDEPDDANEIQEDAIPDDDDLAVLGGWTLQNPLDPIPEDALAAFNKAMESFTGVGYAPQDLLMTQVVSGQNFCFLCKATTVTASPVQYWALVTVYQSLQGEASILSIQPIEP